MNEPLCEAENPYMIFNDLPYSTLDSKLLTVGTKDFLAELLNVYRKAVCPKDSETKA